MSRFQKQVQTCYEITYEEKANGKQVPKYRYCGPWYRFGITEDQLRRLRQQSVSLLLLNASLFLIAALHKCSINTLSIVVVPCMLSIIALIYQAFGVWIFCTRKGKLTEPDLKDYHMAVLTGSGTHAALMLLTAIVGTWFMLTGKVLPQSWWVLLLYGCCGLLSVKVCVLHARLKESVVPNQAE